MTTAADEKLAMVVVPEGGPGTVPGAPTADDASASSPQLQRWNESTLVMLRYFVTIYKFLIMGMNDAILGALIPYLESYYNVSYTVVSLTFLTPFVGYTVAALCNNRIHHHFGQRGIAILSPASRLVAYAVLAAHPPFAALPVVLVFGGLASGFDDSAWNAWVGNMHRANELLGFLHGAYGLGATLAPLIATAMITKAGQPWYAFYYVLAGLAGLEAVVAVPAFWTSTARVYRAAQAGTPDPAGSPATGTGTRTRTSTRRVLRGPLPWLLAVFLFGYVGAEVSLGGWIVSFMLHDRGARPFAAGMVVMGFWLGLTVGRISLGFVTGRIGEKLAITIYLLLAIVLQLLYWLVPVFAASAVFVGLLGFFFGPLFPAAIVAATKLLPPDQHVSAIGFAAAFGGGGAAIFPFVVGAIAQAKGIAVLQPVVVAILVFITLVWCGLPGGFRRGGLEHARLHGQKPGHDLVVLFRWLARRR